MTIRPGLILGTREIMVPFPNDNFIYSPIFSAPPEATSDSLEHTSHSRTNVLTGHK